MSLNRCLISVYDKSGLETFARALTERSVELIASGGTARALREAGMGVREVSDLTASPEILGGRVKTLHPAIHGGILSRRTLADQAQLEDLGWGEIDLVAVNLYPFEQTASDPSATLEQVVEQIDIGGVALLRAAAKNFAHVAVVCDPDDYGTILDELRAHGDVRLETRRALAVKAFAHTASYDAAIQRYLAGPHRPAFPDRMVLGLAKFGELRYGENPHQQAALYLQSGVTGPLGGELLQGKALSYNNLLDLDAAGRTAAAFERPTIVIVKHLSPCGVASADALADAFALALACDPVSAYGGVIAANRPFDAATARALGDLFVEAIAAPGFSEEARQVLASRSNCRLVALSEAIPDSLEYRSVRGGLLVQERDMGDAAEWQVVSQRAPSEAEMAALRFAWRAVAHVKSNAILLAQGEAAVGIGGGLPSRVDAVRLAATKAGDRAVGAVMASDAFFPFADGVEAAAEAGVTAVVEPGGSVRDDQVIAAADRLGLALCFTGVRHFRH
ncbi:MAG: bifunctional phosphoribosylaminoimidazolecarboxamide formyltransferase/IMP cyclohydrolase [Anaerolineales bacterium]|nr:bifunctional phosphoribosylaminoimidazolecarboxamide formyltransferase/IMP cyclohydrolase [Anaerolineales bacterium]